MSSQEMYYSEACGAYNGVKLEQRESAKPSDFSKNTNGNLTTHPLLAHDLLLREDSLLEDPYSHRLDKDPSICESFRNSLEVSRMVFMLLK